ncbi:hypothetical protein PybrP1_006617 [[Pythium] brassicae (nom. inval.)]|nr:hypothetical protein PybrP1_006617 [[Pythium] brassicae (nom. inval.)]
MVAMMVVGVRRHVVAFEGPQREVRALRQVRRAAAAAAAIAGSTTPDALVWRSKHATKCSLAIRDQRVFALVSFLLSDDGGRQHPGDHAALLRAIQATVQCHTGFQAGGNSASVTWDRVASPDELSSVVVATTTTTTAAAAPTLQRPRLLVVLVVYRPDPLLPLCWPSARRAVRFVHAVVSLVTANAFFSTLGGGHFLCRHLDQAKLLAKLQIAVSVGLQDPVLESKCRVNLAYGAMQGGRFGRARRILVREAAVAARLESDELRQVCHAAQVYLAKTLRLHRELLRRTGAEPATGGDRLHDNFYRQRIVRAAT